jgi:hypothetical protein
MVRMPAINVTMPMAELYDGVDFPPRPRLVRTDEAAA